MSHSQHVLNQRAETTYKQREKLPLQQYPITEGTMATATTNESIRPVYVPFGYDEGAESIEDYKPGGFHPTHLGDLLGHDCRYRVVHKLGHGGFGTVWLCRDMKESRWRAVKIIAASHSTGHCADLRICEMLEDLSPREKDARVSHVVVPEDHFWHEGPNGKHLCVVMPVLGPDLEDSAERFQYQEEPLKRICYQLVLAMKFLHSKGICHGDLRPVNICYLLRDLDDLEEEDLLQLFGRPTLLCLVDDGEYDWRSDFLEDYEEDPPIEDPEDCLDEIEEVESIPEASETDATAGSSDDHEPRYIVVTPVLEKSSKYVSDDIAVIDFGESFLASDPPEANGIPQPYRPPEAFFENCGTFGFGSDIYALGCSIFEVKVGSKAFWGNFWDSLRYWEDLNGPLPEPYRSTFAKEADVPEDPSLWVSMDEEEKKQTASENIRRTGVPGLLHKDLLLERRFTVPLAEGEEPLPSPPHSRSTRGGLLAPSGRKVLAYEMSESEALQLLDLFKKTFAWKPEDRITAAEILDHPWFDACRSEEDSQHPEGSASDVSTASDTLAWDEYELDEALVPYCPVDVPLLPWLFRELRRLYGF